MKAIFLFLAFSSISIQYSFANKVDDLKTDTDVARFIVSLDAEFHTKYAERFVINSTEQIIKNRNCNGLAESWGVQSWQKADFNGDGRTDLLVNGYWYNYATYLAIDVGNDKFKLITLSYSPFEKCEISNTISSPYGQLVLFHTNKPDQNSGDNFRKRYPETDTLIYKFESFVEFNKTEAKYNIHSIKFHSGMCLGTCPDFDIEIDKYGQATYNAGMYSPNQGIFEGKIQSKDLDAILNLLNYINVKRLRDNYSVSWTDSPTCTLTIKFSDGSVKKIQDYGEEGTFGLRSVYSLFFALRGNQDWKKN